MLLSKAGIIDELESTMPRHACFTSSWVCSASSRCCPTWLLRRASRHPSLPWPSPLVLLHLRWTLLDEFVDPVCCSTLPRPRPVACSLLRRLFPRMHARFIHVLRVDPDKLDAVK